MRPGFIAPTVHGFLDYVLALALVAVPWVLGLTGVPLVLSLALGVAHGALSLFTAYPLSIMPLVSYRIHALVETAIGAFLLVIGLTAGAGKGLFLIAGAGLFMLAALTDYRAGLPARWGSRVPARRTV